MESDQHEGTKVPVGDVENGGTVLVGVSNLMEGKVVPASECVFVSSPRSVTGVWVLHKSTLVTVPSEQKPE